MAGAQLWGWRQATRGQCSHQSGGMVGEEGQGPGLLFLIHYLRSEKRCPGELGHHMGDHQHLWGERCVERMKDRQKMQEGLPTLPLALTPLESWTRPLCEQLHTLTGEETDLRRVQGQCLGCPSSCGTLALPVHPKSGSPGSLSCPATSSDPLWAACR